MRFAIVVGMLNGKCEDFLNAIITITFYNLHQTVTNMVGTAIG